MLKRVQVGLLSGVVLLAVLFLGKWALLCLITFAACICHTEMIGVMKRIGYKPMLWPGLLYAIAIVPIFTFIGSDGLWAWTAIIMMITLAIRVFTSKRTTYDFFASLVSMLYPMPFFIFFVLALDLPNPMGFTVMIIGLVQAIMTDVFSYFAGVTLGKHKLAPELSPNKTIEGAVGGLLGGILTSIILYQFQFVWKASYELWVFLSLGVLCAIAGPIGDLVASAIKRQVGIKDFGTMFPGHGGMLDRVDSILFTIPVVYTFFRFIVL